jgi:hypothetical protein
MLNTSPRWRSKASLIDTRNRMTVIHIEHIGRELNQVDVHQEDAVCRIE